MDFPTKRNHWFSASGGLECFTTALRDTSPTRSGSCHQGVHGMLSLRFDGRICRTSSWKNDLSLIYPHTFVHEACLDRWISPGFIVRVEIFVCNHSCGGISNWKAFNSLDFHRASDLFHVFHPPKLFQSTVKSTRLGGLKLSRRIPETVN